MPKHTKLVGFRSCGATAVRQGDSNTYEIESFIGLIPSQRVVEHKSGKKYIDGARDTITALRACAVIFRARTDAPPPNIKVTPIYERLGR